MIEVEVKARIKSFKQIMKKLKENNATKYEKEHQEDIYFNSPVKNFVKTDEALRIRKILTDSKNKTFITYKGPKMDNSSKTREEIEVSIDEPYQVSKIFEKLGFIPVHTVIKDRTIYKLDKYVISLDDVNGLEPYMEIEVTLEDEKDYQPILNGIFEIFKKLGIDDGFETRSYLELLENKKI